MQKLRKNTIGTIRFQKIHLLSQYLFIFTIDEKRTHDEKTWDATKGNKYEYGKYHYVKRCGIGATLPSWSPPVIFCISTTRQHQVTGAYQRLRAPTLFPGFPTAAHSQSKFTDEQAPINSKNMWSLIWLCLKLHYPFRVFQLQTFQSKQWRRRLTKAVSWFQRVHDVEGTFGRL